MTILDQFEIEFDNAPTLSAKEELIDALLKYPLNMPVLLDMDGLATPAVDTMKVSESDVICYRAARAIGRGAEFVRIF